MSSLIRASCPCGEIAMEVSAKPIAQFYCHCSDCQRANAAPYGAVSLYPAEAFHVAQGAPRSWTLISMPRSACPKCGAAVFAKPFEDMRGLNALLLPKSAFTPQFHQHCAAAHLPVTDGLPHYKGFPARFGGSDEQVEW